MLYDWSISLKFADGRVIPRVPMVAPSADSRNFLKGLRGQPTLAMDGAEWWPRVASTPIITGASARGWMYCLFRVSEEEVTREKPTLILSFKDFKDKPWTIESPMTKLRFNPELLDRPGIRVPKK